MKRTQKRATAARPRAGKRDQNKEKTKQKILAAALRLFREKGLEATTTREICRKAGIAEGTLFNYFKTKEDLALFFFEKETDNLVEWFHSETRLQKAPLPEQLFAIINRQLEYIAPYEDFIGAIFFQSLKTHSKLSPLSLQSQELRLRYLKFISEVLAAAEERKEIPNVGDLGVYGVGLFYIGIVMHWLHDSSQGKQRTLALLDRSLKLGTQVLRKGGWDW
ncbi:MAG: transcriptional regulator [Verrucomicrobiales bacterium]|nr:transcriptional regulator [Verrucomicrobiales bacterium]